MNCSKMLLSSLLPYEPSTKKNGSLLTGLKEYRMLVRACSEAQSFWKKGDLEKFDSLVGENACQIRAVWLASHASKSSEFFSSFDDQFISIFNKLDKLLVPSTISRMMHTEISLKEILTNEELEVTLDTEEVFLLASFLLCLMKDVKEENLQLSSLYRKEIADPKKAIQLGEVSGSFAKNLLSKLRQIVSVQSVQFVRKTAFAFQDFHLIEMLSEEFVIEQNALSCIPMFWTYKTVLNAASFEGIPLILHAKFLNKNEQDFDLIEEHKLFFLPDASGAYVQVEPTLKDLSKPACVIQGVLTPNAKGHLRSKADWLSLIAEISVIDVILAGAADHRQYPDPKLDSLFSDLESTEYASYKSLARKKGFSAENPSTFFIQHVYAAPVKNHMHAEEIVDDDPMLLNDVNLIVQSFR
jgi:hypothetical protein